jgi:hypothetical protein
VQPLRIKRSQWLAASLSMNSDVHLIINQVLAGKQMETSKYDVRASAVAHAA